MSKFRLTTAAGLGLLLASVAAPIALADVAGYEFLDLDERSSANDSGRASHAATDTQIAAANRKADQALATAQEAIREAQQAKEQQMQQVR
jgi:hypothetical protein